MALGESISKWTEVEYLARERAAESNSEFFNGEIFANVEFVPAPMRTPTAPSR